MTGGGTGGHITPILAVAHELKQLRPDVFVIYVGERKGKFSQLTDGHPSIDSSYSVAAGKLRRYHGQSWISRLLDIRTNLLNIRDSFYLVIGIFQAWLLLGKVRPDVVFLKGGFVGVPIGLAAAVRRIPIVTHDSDALPGLANRIVSRWARLHATALPEEYYSYPAGKVRPVGVLVEHTYQPVTGAMQVEYKKQINLDTTAPMLLVTGGSSGAQRINKVVVKIVDNLLKREPSLRIVHQVGQGNADIYGDYKHDRLKVIEFMKPMYVYTGAADLIVTRAGGNAMAEFGVQGKACIVIPNPDLTGGHQLKNANLLRQRKAAKILLEKDLEDERIGLSAIIAELLENEPERTKLALQLQALTITGAARKLAQLIINLSNER